MLYGIFFSLLLGLGLGMLALDQSHRAVIEVITTISLTIMVFCAGVAIGETEDLLLKLKKNFVVLLIVPTACVFGSVVAAIVAAGLLHMPVRDMLIVTCSLGWYSLATIVVTKLHSVELGTIAFLSNFMREFASFFVIPLIVRCFRNKLLCIPTSGAATMDSLLPIIIQLTNPAVGVVAFVNGVILSILVPIFLQILLN